MMERIGGQIGGQGGLARAAIEAALQAQARAARKIEEQVAAGLSTAAEGAPGAARPPAFASDMAGALRGAVASVEKGLGAVDRLPLEMVSGKVDDFAQLAAQLKQSELSFKFALEVRNKLIDAYRETMRMSV
jgi:flagellar hook-basal body complex protein FliE